MFVDDKSVVMPTVNSGTIPSAGSARIEGLNDKRLVLSRDGFNSMPIAYPSLVNHYTSSWDCDNTGITGNVNDWMTQAIGGGTITAVTTDIASGTPTATEALDLANHPGVISLNSGTNVNSGCQISWGHPLNATQIKGGERFDCVFFPVNLTNTFARIGFHDSVSATDVVDGVYFDVNISTGNVEARVRNNSVLTKLFMLTISQNTWYHFKIQVNNNATEASFFILDMSGVVLAQASIDSNFPLLPGRDVLPRFITARNVAGVLLLYQVDYIGWSVPLQRGATI